MFYSFAQGLVGNGLIKKKKKAIVLFASINPTSHKTYTSKAKQVPCPFNTKNWLGDIAVEQYYI